MTVAIPLLLMAGAAGLGAKAASSRAQARKDAAWTQAQADNVLNMLKIAGATGNAPLVKSLEASAKKYNIDIEPYQTQAVTGSVEREIQDALRTILEGKGTFPVTPQVQADEVMAGTPISEIPEEISRVPISPEMQKRADIRISEKGTPTATFEAPEAGAPFTDSPVQTDNIRGENFVIRTYANGSISRINIPGKVAPTMKEKTIEREAEMMVPVMTDAQGNEVEAPAPMMVYPGTVPPAPYTGFKSFGDSQLQLTINNDLGKKMVGDLQGELKDAADALTTIYAIDSGLKAQYLEGLWQIAQGGAAKIEKWTPQIVEDLIRKIPIIGKRIPSNTEVAAFSQWRNLVDQYMLGWRKKITGVAGGEREMSRIEGIAPNVSQDSYSQFRGKIALLKAIHEALFVRARKWLTEDKINLTQLTEDEREAKFAENPIKGDLSQYIRDPVLRAQWAATALSQDALDFEAKRKK